MEGCWRSYIAKWERNRPFFRVLWQTLWLHNKKAMATRFFQLGAPSIPINDIYSRATAEHLKWQWWLRISFYYYLCAQTCMHRIKTSEKPKLFTWAAPSSQTTVISGRFLSKTIGCISWIASTEPTSSRQLRILKKSRESRSW